jgi:hypothetical protein
MAQEGQDKKGRFVKGHKLAKGRPNKLAELREYERLRHSATPEKLDMFLAKIWEGVAKGDKYCLEFIAKRFFPEEYMADKMAGDSTSSLDGMLEALKAKYIEATVVEPKPAQ